MAKTYDIRVVVIDQNAWYPIVASIDCNYWSVRPPADCHVRTNPNDPNTEDDLPGGNTEALTSATPVIGSNNVTPQANPPRYKAGDPVIYIKSQVATMSVIARFLLVLVLTFGALPVMAQVQEVIPANTEVAGTISANGQTFAIALAGRTGVGFYVTGACTCTFVPEVSYDGGVTYPGGPIVIISGVQYITAVSNPFVNPSGANDVNVIVGMGWTHFRVRVTAYTSGTPSIYVRASNTISPLAIGALGTYVTGGAGGFFSNQMSGLSTNGGTGAVVKAVTECDKQFAINISSATTTQLVALSGTTQIRICAYNITNVGAATAPTWKFVYGTGASCGSGTTDMMGAQSGSTTVGAPTVFGQGDGQGEILSAPAGNALCITTTTTQAQAGWVRYAQY